AVRKPTAVSAVANFSLSWSASATDASASVCVDESVGAKNPPKIGSYSVIPANVVPFGAAFLRPARIFGRFVEIEVSPAVTQLIRSEGWERPWPWSAPMSAGTGGPSPFLGWVLRKCGGAACGDPPGGLHGRAAAGETLPFPVSMRVVFSPPQPSWTSFR